MITFMNPNHFHRTNDMGRKTMARQVKHWIVVRSLVVWLLCGVSPVVYAQWQDAGNEYAYDGFWKRMKTSCFRQSKWDALKRSL